MRTDVLHYQNKPSQDDNQTTLSTRYGQAGAGFHATYTYFHLPGSLPNASVTPVLFSSSILPAPTLHLSSLHNSHGICTIHTKTHAPLTLAPTYSIFSSLPHLQWGHSLSVFQRLLHLLGHTKERRRHAWFKRAVDPTKLLLN